MATGGRGTVKAVSRYYKTFTFIHENGKLMKEDFHEGVYQYAGYNCGY